MALRYTLRSFTPSDTPESLLSAIFPERNSSGMAIGEGAAPKVPWSATFAHLRDIGTKSLLIQSGVIDPDFLEEHQAFYAKQHRAVQATCIRVHAFSSEIIEPPAGFKDQEILEFIDQASTTGECYLGFVTLRPLRHAPVGATILRAKPQLEPTSYDKFPVHIAGSTFDVVGTPFLQQDNAVGACAQASIWMALRTLRRRVGNAAYSPAELTVAATRYLASDRTFPGRQGLTTGQMLEAIRSAGQDPLFVGVRGKEPNRPPPSFQVLSNAVPYTSSGLPVICILFAPDGGHAVVAIGHSASSARTQTLPRTRQLPQAQLSYSLASDWYTGLVIHNDNSGPYLPLSSGNPTSSRPYCLEHTFGLIVPLPEGVYTNAEEAELMALRAIVLASLWFSIGASIAPQLPQVAYVLRPYLCSRHSFRAWAKDDPDLDDVARQFYRTSTLPKVLWVIEIHRESDFDPTRPSERTRLGEVVLDPAADALHGDAMLFVRVTKELWPNSQGFAGLLLIEDDDALKSVALTSGASCAALGTPWPTP